MATGRAVRNAGGPRYRLVATFAGGAEEATRKEFESFPAAQAEVGAFVCDIAERGRPTSIRVERILACAAASNGKSRHEPRSAGETLRRWDEMVIERILGQRFERSVVASRATETCAAPPASVVAREHAPPAAEWTNGETVETFEAAHVQDLAGSESGFGALTTERVERSDPESGVSEIDIPPALENRIPVVHEVLTRETEEVGRASAEATATSPAAAAVTEEQNYSPYRPRHRRTRWVLILTAAFIAIVFGGMILLETNGDPISYLRKVGSGEKVRETLPFRNGDGTATKPAGRK